MERRNFVKYAVASGLGVFGVRYLYGFQTNTGQNDFPGAAAAGHRPLFIPANSGPLGILDISDARLTLSARSTTFRWFRTSSRPF